MAMFFGGVPRLPAHETGNPILPRRDRAMEGGRSKVPPVPRAPRAKPRSQSAGALTRALKSNQEPLRCSTPTRSSEQRHPNEGSPFSHARVNMLARERDSAENQVFEMGPKGRSTSVERTDFIRGQGRLGTQDCRANQGMPWTVPKEEDDPANRVAARRHTLRHEQKAADQSLEWVPREAIASRPPSSDAARSRGRVNVHSREVGGAQQSLEFAPAVQAATAQAAADAKYHGRINVLKREVSKHDEYVEAPRQTGITADSDVPAYGRRTLLARENPVGYAKAVAAH